MSEPHSTSSAPSGKPTKPSKPSPDFPLTAHPAGYWCKKIRGTVHYFGPWADPEGALKKYEAQKEELHSGRRPRPDTASVTVKEAANAFLNHKGDKRDAGELSVRTWAKYKEVTDLLIKEFGKARLVADLRPDDFTALKNTMTKRWGPLRVADFVQHIRSVFKHAFDSELIDRPVRFGPGFARPSQKTMRLHRAKQGPKLFTAEEVRRLLDTAGTPMKAILLLGINCGYGNADVASLPLTALDLAAGWIDYPRPKTGIPRRCPLWPETVAALREAQALRPTPNDPSHTGLVFISRRRTPWCSVREKNRTDGVAVQMTKLLKALGINGRKGLGFYTLRHTFRTVADEARDQPAADFIMGHEVPHMSTVYRETISDERLKAVTDHVRGWLFAPPKKDNPEPKGADAPTQLAGGLGVSTE
jgi:integrase